MFDIKQTNEDFYFVWNCSEQVSRPRLRWDVMFSHGLIMELLTTFHEEGINLSWFRQV